MHLKNLLKVALKSILKSRMRSLLTALGIIIGVAAVVVMVAIGDGAQIQVERQINSLGSNLIIIFPKPTRLIRRILEIATDEDSLVLDSFAGSGTTGHVP